MSKATGKLKDVGEFLVEIAPFLINWGRALFRRHRGDVTAARRDIRSRVQETEAMWKRIEAELAEKHRPR